MGLLTAKTQLLSLGLSLNTSKCKLFGPHGACHDHNLADVPKLQPRNGLVVLRVPVGTDEFITREIARKADDIAQMMDRRKWLGSSLAEFLILRACLGSCWVNFFLTALEFRHGEQLAQRVSRSLKDSLSSVLGSTLNEVQFRLACLRCHLGGLGLQDPVLVHGPANLSACFTFAASSDSILGSLCGEVHLARRRSGRTR